MFHITSLSVAHENGAVLSGITITIESGSIHAIMGPNGSGKSSLAHALIGYPGYDVTSGSIVLNTVDITALSIEKRAHAGLFLAFQYPCALPGVSALHFLTESYRACGNVINSLTDFHKKVEMYARLLAIDVQMLHRDLNDGFSGGEKKKFEVLQLLVLRPRVAILDEIDSGLDVDALQVIARALQVAQQENPSLALIIITHYQRILEYIRPDHVHVISGGAVVATGDAALARAIDTKGYDEYQAHI